MRQTEFERYSVDYIIKTATAIQVDRKGTAINTISLEGLVVAKFRVGRDQDIHDLQSLAIRCGSKISRDEILYSTYMLNTVACRGLRPSLTVELS